MPLLRILRTEFRRPTMWVALLALGMSSLGTAYASGLIGTSEIRDGGVRSVDIRNLDVRAIDVARNAITSTKIKDGTIRRGDLAPGAVSADAIAAGSILADALAGGVVGDRELSPDLARFFTFAGVASPGDPERVLLTVGEFAYSFRCDDLGGGQRASVLVARRTDGGTTWGAGGSQLYLDYGNAAGDLAHAVAGGGVASLELATPSAARTGDQYDLYVSNLSSATNGQRVSAVTSTMFGATPRCSLTGTVTPLPLS